MNERDLMKVLLSPRITEKSARLGDAHNQFVFRVASEATKPDIRRAVEKMFEVEVDAVQVLNVKGKTKRTRSGRGKRSDWKKAYVTLKAGHDIDFMGAE